MPGKCTLMWAWATTHSLHLSGSRMSLNWKWIKQHRPRNPNTLYHEELSSFMVTVENYDDKLLCKPIAQKQKTFYFIRPTRVPLIVWHHSICTTKKKMRPIKLWHIINFKQQPGFVDIKIWKENEHFGISEIWHYSLTQIWILMLKIPKHQVFVCFSRTELWFLSKL